MQYSTSSICGPSMYEDEPVRKAFEGATLARFVAELARRADLKLTLEILRSIDAQWYDDRYGLVDGDTGEVVVEVGTWMYHVSVDIPT